jgi:integrase/recombinase XerD
MDISDFLSSKLPPQWSDGHISHQLQALRCFFDFLYLGGVVDAVAPRFLRARKPIRKLPKTLTQARTKKLIATANNSRDRALMEVFYATGCRVGEVVDIRIERIDFKRRCFAVTGKRTERMVYFGSTAAQAIRRYLGKKRKTGYLFQDIFPPQKGYVTRSRVAWTGNWRDYSNGGKKRMKYLGNPARVSYTTARRRFKKYLSDNKIDLVRPKGERPLTRSTLGRIVQDIARRANLGVVSPHMLRHSFATHMLEGGADIRAIQELLGHAYLTSTQVYTRVSNNAVAATFRRCHPRGA